MFESKSLRVAYGEALAELGSIDQKVVVLDADLGVSAVMHAGTRL